VRISLQVSLYVVVGDSRDTSKIGLATSCCHSPWPTRGQTFVNTAEDSKDELCGHAVRLDADRRPDAFPLDLEAQQLSTSTMTEIP
jgi:hypothetical protein